MAAVLLEGYQDWYCPQCGLEERTPRLPANASRMHTCPKLHGLTAPLAPAGTSCTIVAEERGDYLNGEIQETGDDGKPYMAVRTVFEDHDDVRVHAGLARAELSAREYG